MWSKNLFAVILLILFLADTQAQDGRDAPVADQEIASIVKSIARLVRANYVDEEVGETIAKHLETTQATGVYTGLTYAALGKQLTKDLRAANGDLHLAAYYHVPQETPTASHLDHKFGRYGETSNYGFVETTVLEPNIGYLKIAHFTNYAYLSEAKVAVDRSLAILQNVDALILDVRDNPGGFEDIVAYFVSYFIDGPPVLLQEYYARNTGRTTSISTTRNAPGKKRPDLPLYVLTNEQTGSAAESLAYLLKHLGRAKIVGDTTAGAGNGASSYTVAENFMVQIATVETINQVTKTSWEQVGVRPTIVAADEKALDVATNLAITAARQYRTQREQEYRTLLTAMEAALAAEDKESIVTTLIACQEVGLLNEQKINSLGYEYLGPKGKVALAQTIFAVNTDLYPSSPNVFDSYAESLARNGDKKLAIANYAKAVALAREQEDPNLELFLNNLQQARK
ncbi:MAG: S41 family peptidase [Bacteroidota bacterium]